MLFGPGKLAASPLDGQPRVDLSLERLPLAQLQQDPASFKAALDRIGSLRA